MKDRQVAKKHLELTTGSLLIRRSRWAFLTNNLPQRSLLLVVPRDRPRIRICLLRVAQTYASRGGEAVIRYSA